jgi:glucokinase
VILAGDIGGTNTALALFDRDPASGALSELSSTNFPSAKHESFEEIVSLFLEEERRASGLVDAACFGIAGAVLDGRVSTTNLPWNEIDATRLARLIGVAQVTLLNDLEATAYGMLALEESEFVDLNPDARVSRAGTAVVIAAGTGLGAAQLIWDGSSHFAAAGEGGHADFAPRNEEEIQLHRFLQAEVRGRVSWERILSGRGLSSLYRFVRASAQLDEPEPAWLAERLADEDPSSVISELALADKDSACVRALELFSAIYGAEAGNMALRALAVGGVFLAGGIAPKILPFLKRGPFMSAFTDKGRFSDFMRKTPVRVATNDSAPVLGAAHRAVLAGRRS